MSDSILVRVTLGSYDFAHPAEKQTHVYVQIPEVARASWMLPAGMFHGLAGRAWPEVLDVADDHYTHSGVVSDSTSAATRAAVRTWLLEDSNRDEMQAAWEEDQARQHPVASTLLRDNDRLLRLVTELEKANAGLDDLRQQALARVAELLDERHTTNEALSEAAEALRENQARIAELERPAVERHRREVRESYRWLAAQAREDGDFEGETVVAQQLAEREQLWAHEDALAKEFAADPLAVKPWRPGPSAEVSADRLTRLLAPTQALREAVVPPLTVYRASHDSIVIERYTTAAEARKHCEALLRREEPDAELAWTEEEDDVQSLTFTVNGEFQDWSGYVVTRLAIASEYDPDGDE